MMAVLNRSLRLILKYQNFIALLAIIVFILVVETKMSSSIIISQQEESSWTNLSPSIAPNNRTDFKAVYDIKSAKIFIFGGLYLLHGEFHNDTWIYDSSTNLWTEISTINPPQGRNGYELAYDEESQRIILFSGFKIPYNPWDWTCWNETWAFNSDENTWQFLDPSIQPPGRGFADMVYDNDSDRIILFGGLNKKGLNADTWAYDLNSNQWTNMTTSIHPSPRLGHRMVYDEESDLVILFGGTIELPPHPIAVKDTWTYDYDTNTWTNVTPSLSPPGLLNHGLAYDAKSDRVILYGGAGSDLRNIGETWVYNTNTNSWVNMTSNFSPSPRRRFSMTYDKESDQTIIFAGCIDNFTPLNETWAYTYQTDEESTITTTTTSQKPSIPIEWGLLSLVLIANQIKRRKKLKNRK